MGVGLQRPLLSWGDLKRDRYLGSLAQSRQPLGGWHPPLQPDPEPGLVAHRLDNQSPDVGAGLQYQQRVRSRTGYVNHYYVPPFSSYGVPYHWNTYFVTIEQDRINDASTSHDYAIDQNGHLAPHN